MNNKDYAFYDSVPPIKLTEACSVKLHSKGWGLLTDYYLESVKINNRKGETVSAATLRIEDISGQTICVIKGCSVGLLFGLSAEQWREVENMCLPGQQLYYRYFKNGITSSHSYEQKLFYNFCSSSQNHDVFVAKFIRCVNTRTNFKNVPLLDILVLRKCDTHLLDLYTENLRKNSQ